jgi:hypothetical protein
MVDALPERDALYYPYAHIRDPDWLKATLLCFSQVQRIHPDGYPARSELEEQIQRFTEVDGPRGPLLKNVREWSPGMESAMKRLLELLKQHEGEVRTRLARSIVEPLVKNAPDSRLIHRLKLSPVLKFLKRGPDPLAWPCPGYETGDGWYALHPDLAKAVMSTLAISIARDEGLDIVTDTPTVHNTVSASTEEQVFEQLMRGPLATPRLHGENGYERAEDLAHFFVIHCVDVNQLSVDDVAALSREKKNLASFRERVADLARTIPKMENAKSYRRRLADAAGQIVSEWERQGANLPFRAGIALTGAAGLGVPKAVESYLGSGADGWMLAVGKMVAVGCVAIPGWNVARDFLQSTGDPYPYLSQIRASGATIHKPEESLLTFPQQHVQGE